MSNDPTDPVPTADEGEIEAAAADFEPYADLIPEDVLPVAGIRIVLGYHFGGGRRFLSYMVDTDDADALAVIGALETVKVRLGMNERMGE